MAPIYLYFTNNDPFSPLALHLVAMYMKVQNKRTFTSSTLCNPLLAGHFQNEEHFNLNIANFQNEEHFLMKLCM
jgi:hypothetical protein